MLQRERRVKSADRTRPERTVADTPVPSRPRRVPSPTRDIAIDASLPRSTPSTSVTSSSRVETRKYYSVARPAERPTIRTGPAHVL